MSSHYMKPPLDPEGLPYLSGARSLSSLHDPGAVLSDRVPQSHLESVPETFLGREPLRNELHATMGGKALM